jgi:DNA-binding MarR family transcriptional regulator
MPRTCYCAALREAARKTTSLYDAALLPVGVNLAQFAMLRMIARAEPVSLTELGRLCALDRSTVGRNARVLARLDLVRAGEGRDQRAATLSLAAKGRAVLEDGAKLWEAAQARIETALGREGAASLMTLLNDL